MSRKKEARERALAELYGSRLGVQVKGIPPQHAGLALSDIGRQGWGLLSGDLTMPAAVLRKSAIEHNSRWMRAFIAENGLAIAPHGKTTLAPQLFDIQERDGAWAMTVSNVQQVALCRRFAFDRILIANQIIGRTEIEYLFAELDRSPELELFVLVDSIETVQRIAVVAKAHRSAVRLGLLLEIGVTGGRTGTRSFDSAMEIARSIRPTGLSLAGVEGFEGLLKGTEAVDTFLDMIARVAVACRDERLFAIDPPILSAGGTAYYDRVAARLGPEGKDGRFRIVTRSGCYLTHDSLMYEQSYREIRKRDSELLPSGDPLPALMVWTCIQSRPEPERAILTMGRRDVGFDAGLPVPLLWYRDGIHQKPVGIGEGYRVDALNDQHAYLTVPAASELAVGDLVGFGISHPCTTFDKWQVVFVIDDDYRVVDAVKTFF